jgi:hypothetical protein
MRSQLLTRLAWTLWALTLVLAVLSQIFNAIGIPAVRPARADLWVFFGFLTFAAMAFATVGALIVTRYPGHTIGWLFSASGALLGVMIAAGSYATVTEYARVGVWPYGEYAFWLYLLVAWPCTCLCGPLLLLLFPTGRLMSSRWRPAAWLAGGGALMLGLSSALKPGPMADTPPGLDNPFGVAAPRLLDGLLLCGLLALAVSALAAAVSLFLRLRRARGAERQQIKWIAYVSAVLGGGIAGSTLPDSLGSISDGLFMLSIAALAFFPGVVGLAILRHQLFDIDRLINRTLVYALLSGALGLVYVAGVVLFQRMLDPLIEGNDLAIAASTLAVAGLFRPTRRRIQAAVDWRFYRDRYDAAATVATFSNRLQAALDLEALSAELQAIVQSTMQPTQVSLWLRAPAPATTTRTAPIGHADRLG